MSQWIPEPLDSLELFAGAILQEIAVAEQRVRHFETLKAVADDIAAKTGAHVEVCGGEHFGTTYSKSQACDFIASFNDIEPNQLRQHFHFSERATRIARLRAALEAGGGAPLRKKAKKKTNDALPPALTWTCSEVAEVRAVSSCELKLNVTCKLNVTTKREQFEVLTQFIIGVNCSTETEFINYFGQFQKLRGEPLYCHLVMEDVLRQSHNALLNRILKGTSDSIRNACRILKLWVWQQKYAQYGDSLNGFLLEVLVAYLVSVKLLLPEMTAAQVVRRVATFLSTGWTSAEMRAFPDTNGYGPDEDVTKMFAGRFDVVLLDPTHRFNFFYRMSKSAHDEVQRDAGLLAGVLDSNYLSKYMEVSSLQKSFVHSSPIFLRFDQILCVSAPVQIPATKEADKAPKLKRKANGSQEELSVHFKLTEKDINERFTFASKVTQVLSRALDGRVAAVRGFWSPENGYRQLCVGIKFKALDDSKTFSIITKGPAVELEAEVAAFDEFWGEKTEKRKWSDGSVVKAILWRTAEELNSITTSQRFAILRDISRHALHLHCEVKPDDVNLVGPYELENAFRQSFFVSGAERDDELNAASPTLDELEKECLTAYQSYQKLSGLLTQLKVRGVPSITTVYPGHPILRRTCPYRIGKVLSSRACTRNVEPIHIIIAFERPKWPENIEAARNLQSLYLFRAIENLIEEHGDAEYLSHSISSYSTVDVVVREGYCFRVHVQNWKEYSLLAKSGQEQLAIKWLWQYNVSAEHSAAVRACGNTFSSFGRATQLALRWLAAQFLLGFHVSEEICEALMLHVYHNSYPFSAPLSADAAFYRFLNLIRTHDWDNEPLVVQLPDTPSVYGKVLKQFEKARKDGTGSYMWVSTSYCSEFCLGRSGQPDANTCRRLRTLAEVSVAHVDNVYQTIQLPLKTNRWNVLFKCNEKAFKTVFRVAPRFTMRRMSSNVFSAKKLVAVVKSIKMYCQKNVVEDDQDKNPKFRDLDLDKITSTRHSLILHHVVNYDPLSFFVGSLRRDLLMHCKIFTDVHIGGKVALIPLAEMDESRWPQLVNDVLRTSDGLLQPI